MMKTPVLDKNYRSDIDGLRAIAVMAVVLFHLQVLPFSGGYIGVDVFFVISGFLITRILCREIDEGRFSIVRFYERRMRRIAPALFSVILFSFVVGYFIFFPSDLKDLGRSVRYTLLMAANIYWWKSLDYFSAPAETKPMLHMWSLGVEEQFYVFLPLILLFIAFKFLRWRVHILWGLLVISLAFSLFYVLKNPPLVFFWLPFRAWELLAGSVIIFLPNSSRLSPRLNWVLSILGFLLVVAPIFYLQKYSLFPGFNAIPPVLGSALLIWVGIGYQGGVARILSLKPVVYIGLISYSLYLWHWPMIVYARYWFVDALTVWQMIALIIAIFVASILSYHFIERPFRNRKLVSPKGILYFTIIGAVILFATALRFDKTEGLPNRIPDDVEVYLNESYKIEGIPERCSGIVLPLKIDPMGECHLGVKNKAPTVFLLGDSFSGAISGSFSEFLEQNNQAGIVAATGACPPILGLGTWVPFGVDKCEALQDKTLKMIDNWKIKTVVLYARWPALERPNDFQWIKAPKHKKFEKTLEAAFSRTVTELLKRNIKIVIIESAPIYDKSIPLTMARNKMLNKPLDITMPLQDVLKGTKTENKLFSFYKNSPDILFIDLKEQFCSNGICHATHNGNPLYWDEGHLNRFGAELIMPAYEKMKPFLGWKD